MRRDRHHRRGNFAATAACAAALAAALPAKADPVADFYAAHRITVLVGSAVGGGYDAYGRLLAAHLGAFLPGHPDLVVQNMPGAGTLLATNYVVNVGPKDGTMIGGVNPAIVTQALLNPEQAKFDPRTFHWIGNLLRETETVAVWHTAPVQKFSDLFDKTLRVAGTGGATTLYPLLLDGVLSTKFDVVKGYSGTHAAFLAVERGEVQGIGGATWASLKATEGAFLRDKQLTVIAHYGLETPPDLAGVPAVLDYAKTPDQKSALLFVLRGQEFGRPFMTAPEVPAERVKALQAAFAAMIKDKDFLADAARRKLDLDPTSGQDVAKLVEAIYDTPAPVVAEDKQILGNLQ